MRKRHDVSWSYTQEAEGDPETDQRYCYELRRYCVLPWRVSDTDIVYALLLVTIVYVVPELTITIEASFIKRTNR